ncbi:RloB family protein [Ignatzschineria rhizosphaerae]|uniref:RloB family protein n=1 Tax=Ignatzschineria rhizosphaerae TaxID=2923279 RepID=A0ABY3X3E0_9GAMM|nr:RloB domain-containing protein [Ignatzschineria rhizosphaerae]UNM95542.1 RloB family protein [Ignatzschineria rhizosphaerae]
MSLYVLVEGRRTEKIIYPNWIIENTNFIKKRTPEAPQDNEFYIISGNGYPSIITNYLENAIKEVNEYNYDNFWIVVDADEEDIDKRKAYIESNIQKYSLNKTVIVNIIIQKICIETFGLANNNFFPTDENLSEELKEFKHKYDVTTYDPSLLTSDKKQNNMNTAHYHGAYLKAIFSANNLRYTKKNPGVFKNKDFFNGIKKRVLETNHVSSFKDILVALDQIKTTTK